MSGLNFPVGLCMLQVMHPAISQPSTASGILAFSSLRLSGSCCSRRKVVYGAKTQGFSGYLYTRWCFHIPALRFHGAQSPVYRARYVGHYPASLTAGWASCSTWILGFASNRLTIAHFRDVGILGV